jgi:hypothetical protein
MEGYVAVCTHRYTDGDHCHGEISGRYTVKEVQLYRVHPVGLDPIKADKPRAWAWGPAISDRGGAGIGGLDSSRNSLSPPVDHG